VFVCFFLIPPNLAHAGKNAPKKNNNVQLSMVSGGGTDGEKKGGKIVASRRDCDGAGEDGPRVPRIIDFGSWSIWVIGKGVGVGVGHGDGKGRRKGGNNKTIQKRKKIQN